MRAGASCASRRGRILASRGVRRRCTRTSTSTCSDSFTNSSRHADWRRGGDGAPLRRGAGVALGAELRSQPVHRRHPARLLAAVAGRRRGPLYNKAIKGTYSPGSIWKLHTAIIAMEEGLVKIGDRMPVACTAATSSAIAYFPMLEARWARHSTLAEAIEGRAHVLLPAWRSASGCSAWWLAAFESALATARALTCRRRRARSFRLIRRASTTTGSSVRAAGRRGDAEPRDWAGRELADRREYGAVLHGVGDGWRGRASRSRARESQRTRLFNVTPQQLRQLQDAMTAWWGGARRIGSRIEGIAVAGKTGTRRTRRTRARSRVVRGLCARRRSEDRRRGAARVRRQWLSRGARGHAHHEHYLKQSVAALPVAEGP
jgi:hypothetical protein